MFKWIDMQWTKPFMCKYVCEIMGFLCKFLMCKCSIVTPRGKNSGLENNVSFFH